MQLIGFLLKAFIILSMIWLGSWLGPIIFGLIALKMFDIISTDPPEMNSVERDII